jgi:hypothetical protein
LAAKSAKLIGAAPVTATASSLGSEPIFADPKP